MSSIGSKAKGGSGSEHLAARAAPVERIVVSEIAQSDLLDIWLYAARDDPSSADKLIDEIYARFRLLAATPRIGRRRPELDKAIRSFVVAGYVIFYRQSAKGIEVARVLHGHRDIRSLFQP